MTTTVISEERIIEMKGDLTVSRFYRDDIIIIDGKDVAEVLEECFEGIRSKAAYWMTEYGRFCITIERLGDK